MYSENEKIYCISLGCPKNQADIEHILAILQKYLPNVSFTKDLFKATLLLINTCSFIEEAVSESIDTILEIAQKKQQGQKLCVVGCLPLRYKKNILEPLPEVDFFSFKNEPEEIALDLICFLLKKNNHSIRLTKRDKIERIYTGSPFSAFVKISDGCSRKCTYCLIPKIKGGIRHRNPKDIIQEINILNQKGTKEIILVAQDLTSYNYNDLTLTDLLEKILNNTNIKWLRLMYLYPQGITEKLLKFIKNEPRICNYLDIPIQHASDKILRRMGRRITKNSLNKLFETIKKILPGCSLRTTVMTGFPGEDEKDFEMLVDFIKNWEFHHLGCFTYSDEDEAYSKRFKEKVNKEIAHARKEEILKLQREISYKINQSYIGKKIDVLVNGYCKETNLLICGRSHFQAPEVDGTIYINKGNATPGNIEKVLITEAYHYDLVGEIIV